MSRKLRLAHFIFFMFLFVVNYGQVSVWKKSNRLQKNSIENQTDDSLYHLDVDLLLQSIKSNNQTIISFPDKNDKVTNFKVKQTQILPPSLQKKYSSIYSFKGVATDGSGKTIRFTFSKEFGLKGSINDNNKSRLNIKPKNNTEHLFSIEDKSKASPYDCYTDEVLINQFEFKDNSTKLDINDGKLRRYRIAVSTSGEYSNFFLDGSEVNDTEKITKVLTAVSASIERINELFEVDLGITLQLIENNDQLIFLNASTDPYTNSFNSELQNELDTNEFIGSEAYDVGHLFHYDGNTYGNAGCIACVCTEGQKGSGFTAHQDPSSEGMNNILAHELGHQFGAYHTQSSTSCASGFNSEVEPGSGSTIMSYAGICFPNVQNEADFYYNYTSIRDIGQWVIQDSNCAEIIDINNEAPVVSAGDDYVIPISTPFILTADATDANSEDVLTYCWEQSDADTPFSSDYPSSLQTSGPVFRSFLPSLNNKRYFPELSHIINGTYAEWEVLPEVARDLNFSLTVRDNSIEGGQTVTDLMTITVNDVSGPFAVTSQNTSNTIWNVGEQVSVTWDVANTNLAPINTTLVDIYISIDGGLNFDTKILENTENDGEVSFILPDVESTTDARIMVKAVNNIYYSVNSASFQVQKSEFVISSSEPEIESCNIDAFTYDLNYRTFLSFNETVSTTVGGLPVGLNYEFSQSTFTDSVIDGLDFTLTISGAESLEVGSYSFFIKGISDASEIEKSIELEFTIYENLENTQITLTAPIDGSNSVSVPTILDWVESENATEYLLELSTFEDFSEIDFSTTTILNNYQIDNIEYNTEYFWRVAALNACDNQSDYTTYSFSTVCISPLAFEASDISTTSISTTWEDTTNSSWEIEYGETGFAKGNGTIIEVSETNYTIEDLNSSTEYDIYLRSKCSIGAYSEYNELTKISTYANYCGGDHFYDTGGANEPYSNLESYTITIAPDNSTDRVKAIFNYINVEFGYDFLSVYNGNSTDNDLIETYTGSYTNIELVSSHSSGALTFSFSSDQIVTNDGWDAEIFCEPKPNCLAPINYEIENITTESAQLSWVATDDETNWKVEYGPSGFIRGEGEIINTSETNLNITNLNSNTFYEIYLETICSSGGFSETISSSFMTNADYCGGEHFYDNGGPNNNYIPGNTYTTTIYPDEEGYRVRALFEYIDIIQNSDYLVVFNGENNSDEFLEFYSGNYSNVEIVSTHPSGALTFEFITNSTTTSLGWDAEIVCELKPCESPTNIVSTLVTSSSMSIEWTTYLNDVNSIIEYGPQGFVLGNGTELNTDVNNITIEGLESLTTYDIYIKNSCVNDTYSDYSAVASFTTQADFCSGDHFYDTGGEFGNYSNSENYTQTIYPEETNDRIRAIFNLFDLESCCDRLIIYDGPSDSDKLIGEYRSTSPGEIFSSHESGALTFTFISDGSVTSDGWDAEIICEDQPNCDAPINFITTNITTNSAQIEWEAVGDDSSWDIEYGPVGFTKGSGIKIIAESNSVTIDELISYTDYEIYVNTICDLGGISNPVSFSFRTAADYCAGDHFYDTGGPFDTYENSENYVETIYPTEDGDRIKIIFDSFYTYNSDILYIYDGPNTDAELIAELSGGIYDDPEFKSTHETGALTFAFISDDFSFTSGWDAEVICEAKPSCSTPSNIEISNTTVSTSVISWTQEENDVANWLIEYGESGFTRGNGATITSNTNSINLFFLESATTYDVYIAAVCSDLTNSDYQLISFTTIPDYCAGDPYYDTGGNFNSYENNENSITTIYPDNINDRIRVEFTYFNTEDSEDILYIYDGVDTSGELLAELSGYISEDLEYIASHESGALTFNFISNESNIFSGWVANITCETKPSCTAPTNFTTSNIDPNNTLLEWNADESINNWYIEYGLSGFIRGKGTIIYSNSSSTTLSSLISNTYYDVYLHNFCNDNTLSDFIKITFSTSADYCAGDLFYDTGGVSSNYDSNEDVTTTIYPDSDNERVRATFTYFYTENFQDILYVYDGIDTNGELLAELTGYIAEDLEFVSTHESGALTFNFVSNESNNYNGWISSIICETKPNCSAPTNFSVSEIDSTTVLLEWDEVLENSNGYSITYGIADFDIENGDGTTLITQDNSIEISNIEAGRLYNYYIQTACTNDTFSDALMENFQTIIDYCAGSHFYDTGGEFGNYSNNENYTQTIYPDTNSEIIRVLFSVINVESNYDYLYVYDGDSTNSNLLGTYSGSYTNIEHVSTHSSGALTFRFTTDGSVTRTGWDATISCEVGPNCSAPSDISITNITSNSASVAWSETLDSENYSLEYGETGFEYGTGIQITTSDTNTTLSPLESGINYDIYLVSNCSVGGTSGILGPITFKTLCNEPNTVDNEYIIDGSFECVNTTVWEGLSSENEIIIEDPCNIPFTAFQNSELLCLDFYDVGNTFYPTDGNYAAYASLLSSSGNMHSISQRITLPSDVANSTLSFDTKALYYYIESSSNPNNFTTEIIFYDGTEVEISKIDITTDDNIILEQAYEFEYSLLENITDYLVGYENTDIEIKFSFNSTDDYSIVADLMLDNVSLIIEGSTLSNDQNEYLKNNLSIFPVPNNGTFTISNTSDIDINKVIVYDLLGRYVQENTYGIKFKEELFTIDNASSGVYFLNIETDKGDVVLKVVVE